MNKDSYYALLETEPWKEFRRAFIARKDCRCEICGTEKKRGLQVHHKCYRIGLKPWDYPDTDLLCLCRDCHLKLHLQLADEQRYIPVYDGDNRINTFSVPDRFVCRHCGGTGFKEDFPYLLGGICFCCFGTGLRYTHLFSPGEAEYYSHKIYNQWLSFHERTGNCLENPRFSCAADVKRMLLRFNELQ